MGLRPPLQVDAPPDGLVWHYTNATGLIAILSSHTLWATSAQFLNDAGEVALAVELLQAELTRRAADGDDFFRDAAALIEQGGRDHEISPSLFFVLSAAGGWDLLAMWRNYGGTRGGQESYAIGLHPDSPLAVLAASADTGEVGVRHRAWAPVRYSAEDQAALVDAVFDDLPDEVARAIDLASTGATRAEVMTDAADLLDDMEQALLLIKHEGFTDERETRHSTVLYRGPHDGALPTGLVRYRATPYGLAPYLCLTGGDGAPVRTDASRLPIRAVAMSPSPHGTAAVGSLLDLMAEHGYGDVPVVRSRIPFRG
ncbi:hypothetical protein EUA93_06295 [Nocardioides oleivorans]|uniref:DUF2971 domain-containing protein n=1 Tax=Nocardioides oleivorans TaxID=273676 RepID=A0A4Q2RYT5_9ACTN|nr:hypothetical protein [Nocardioides oleivorans]RYB93996.1 hypothetical protein EUA93_06295 [Nocardioides oleivorans]